MKKQIRLSESELKAFIDECVKGVLNEGIPNNKYPTPLYNPNTKEWDKSGVKGFPSKDDVENLGFFKPYGNDPINYEAIAIWMLQKGMVPSDLFGSATKKGSTRTNYNFPGMGNIVSAYGIDEVVYGIDRAITNLSAKYGNLQKVFNERSVEIKNRLKQNPNVRFKDVKAPSVSDFLRDKDVDYSENYSDVPSQSQTMDTILKVVGDDEAFGENMTPQERVEKFLNKIPGTTGGSTDKYRKLDMLKDDITDFILKRKLQRMSSQYLNPDDKDYDTERDVVMKGKGQTLDQFEREEGKKVDKNEKEIAKDYEEGANDIMKRYGLTRDEFDALVDSEYGKMVR